MTSTEWALLLALSVLWGGSFFFVAVAVGNLPPLTIVLLRVGIAAFVLNVVLRITGTRLPAGREIWTALVVMSVLNNVVPFCLFVWAQARLTGGVAAIMNATTPLFGVLVAHAFLRDEPLNAGRASGVALGFGGVVVMIGPSVLAGLGHEIAAEAACLLAALVYAVAGVYGRRFARLGVTPLQTATGQLTTSSLIMLPVALFVEQPWRLSTPGPGVWAALLALATLSTALGYILYFRILSTAGATNLLLVTFLIPVSAIVLGAWFLGETLEPRHLAGIVLIGAGLAFIDGRLPRWAVAQRSTRSAP
jgi:drug/metabolite transporter (DMT)-like permease